MNPLDQQRAFYGKAAASYDAQWAYDPNDEHYIACSILSGLINHYAVTSLLDVGCGTGRALHYFQKQHPDLLLRGLEPVAQLREMAVKKGIAAESLLEGDAAELPFPDGHFDCVTLFGVLHHMPKPHLAIKEALRVSRKMVYLSDHNIYGMGSPATKKIKQILRKLRLQKWLNLYLTRGKGYHDTNWDGVFYPFSLIDHIPQIREGVEQYYTFSTKTPAINFFTDASHFAILGIKK